MQVKLKVDLCRPSAEPKSSGIIWNAERGCHCHPPESEMLKAYSDPRIQLLQQTYVMHVSVVMVDEDEE